MYARCTLIVLSPTEARKQFFHLGELAAREPVLVPASIPFIVMPVTSLSAPAPHAATPAHHVDFAFLKSLNLGDVEFPPMSVAMRAPEL